MANEAAVAGALKSHGFGMSVDLASFSIDNASAPSGGQYRYALGPDFRSAAASESLLSGRDWFPNS